MATETVKTPVTMTDGRVVEFTSKQRLSKEATIAEDGTITGRFDFRNGETRSFTVPPSLLLKFAAHGMEQKIGDSIAGETDNDDAVLAMDDLLARLNAGEWSVGRSGGNAFSGSSILLRALWEVRGATETEAKEKIKTWLGTKTQAEKLALRRMDAIKPVIERMEAEKAANSKGGSNVDTSALFGELEEIGGTEEAPGPEMGRKSKAVG